MKVFRDFDLMMVMAVTAVSLGYSPIARAGDDSLKQILNESRKTSDSLDKIEEAIVNDRKERIHLINSKKLSPTDVFSKGAVIAMEGVISVPEYKSTESLFLSKGNVSTRKPSGKTPYCEVYNPDAEFTAEKDRLSAELQKAKELFARQDVENQQAWDSIVAAKVKEVKECLEKFDGDYELGFTGKDHFGDESFGIRSPRGWVVIRKKAFGEYFSDMKKWAIREIESRIWLKVSDTEDFDGRFKIFESLNLTNDFYSIMDRKKQQKQQLADATKALNNLSPSFRRPPSEPGTFLSSRLKVAAIVPHADAKGLNKEQFDLIAYSGKGNAAPYRLQCHNAKDLSQITQIFGANTKFVASDEAFSALEAMESASKGMSDLSPSASGQDSKSSTDTTKSKSTAPAAREAAPIAPVKANAI